MQSLELTAKNVDEARGIAATKLGVDPAELTMTVLEESKGLFGKTQVRVRAEVVVTAAAAEPPAPKSKAERAPKAAKPAKEQPAVEPPPAAPTAEKKPRGRRGKTGETAGTVASAPETPAAEAETDAEEVVATQQDADNFLGVLNTLLEKSGLEIEAKSLGYSGKYVNIQFDGKDTGYLVGKHGEVLNAFQYLTNIIAAQQWGNGVRAVLDGNDYRSRREEQLTHLATKIAEQVVKRGEEAVLDALPAFERRIVHKAISEMAGVTTYSEGEEPNRRVVIAPAD